MEQQMIQEIFFEDPIAFRLDKFKILEGMRGLYFVFRDEITIPYPFQNSRLIYIGMSAEVTNGIGKRLESHFKGGNIGISNYKEKENLLFTYKNIERIDGWHKRIKLLESYFITDFISFSGCLPICNNQSDKEILTKNSQTFFNINWSYFNGKQ